MKPLQPLRRASLPMQRQWQSMTKPEQVINRIRFGDADKDGVPNKWDCRPKNPFRQDSGKNHRHIYDNEGLEGRDYENYCLVCGVSKSMCAVCGKNHGREEYGGHLCSSECERKYIENEDYYSR